MPSSLPHLLPLLLLFLLPLLHPSHSLPPQSLSLLSIKSLIHADPLGIFSDWTPGSDPCTWRGVRCNAAALVVSLRIPAACSHLPHLGDAEFRSCDEISDDGYLPTSPYLARCQNSDSSGVSRPCRLEGKLSPAIGDLRWLTVLSLPHNSLVGEIPKEISGLRHLQVIDLEDNKFAGAIPAGIGQLRELRILNLAHNQLEGDVPQDISGCRKLKMVRLSHNRLSGGVPLFLKDLDVLQVLQLSSNRFSGTIPSEIANNCRKLKHIQLDNNFFRGRIPSTLGNCPSLQTLTVSSNLLSGPIPAEIGRLTRLQVLDVSCNRLGGSIPPQLTNCLHLSVLVLTNTEFCIHGSWNNGIYQKHEFNLFTNLPAFLYTLPSLQILWAPRAALKGALPPDWPSCQDLRMLNIAGNWIVGTIPEGLAGCKNLIYMDLSANKLTGVLPLKTPLHCMVVFNVSGNSLEGPLPHMRSDRYLKSEIFEPVLPITHMPWFQDDESFLISVIRSFFWRLYYEVISRFTSPGWFPHHGISVVHDKSDNNFTGSVLGKELRDSLTNRKPSFGYLETGDKLRGAISSRVFQSCGKFQTLILKLLRNQFSVSLPAEAMSTCNFLKVFEAAENQLSGNIPIAMGKMKLLISLDLRMNNLSGGLPSDVPQLQELQYLLLANNKFTGTIPGTIPAEYGNPTSLRVLDLSNNRLTGNIPEALGNRNKLTSLSLGNNHLSGTIPRILKKLKYLSVVVLDFNYVPGFMSQSRSLAPCGSGRCSNRRKLHQYDDTSTVAPSIDDNEETLPYATQIVVEKTHHPNSIVVAAIASGCTIFVVLTILVLLFHCTKPEAQRPDAHHTVSKHVTIFHRFNFLLTYDNVVAGTGNFSVNNLIGNGGFGATYKAEFLPNVIVAVKRLSLGRFPGGTQQFEAEVQTLGMVKHPNLVTLIGYHASESEMFLIYNYLPGGNLESLLHGKKGFLSWKVRYKIALDIAQALAYLHDECTPRVLHRDIKPSNVLLDNNLNAYLSDFGLARLLSDSETHATTDVAGTFGYVAPEYAMTCRLSDKADVYSYGVVLLEILSGKRALDPYFSNYGHGFNIVTWAYQLYQKDNSAEVLDPELWEQGSHSELLSVLKLAVRCTMASLAVRPRMKQVVDALKVLQ